MDTFAQQQQQQQPQAQQQHPFEADMMKRNIDPVGSEPWSKKARSSPSGAPYVAPIKIDDFSSYQNGYQHQPLYGSATSPIPPSPLFAAATVQAQQQQQQQAHQQVPSPLSSYPMVNGMRVPHILTPEHYQMLSSYSSPGYLPFGSSLAQMNVTSPTSPSGYMSLANGLMGVSSGGGGSGGGQPTARTVYIGNLPTSASVDELLNLVHFGPIESIRVLPEKSCIFLSFLDSQTATAFHADATIKRLTLHNSELKIGWGKPSPVPSQVLLSIQQSNASRNVYLGGLDEGATEETLRNDLERFGLIDQIKIVRDKSIAFVHFLSISTATKVVATLPTEPAWAGKRVNYGKDRCAYVPKSHQAAAQQAQVAAAQTLVSQLPPLSIPTQTMGGLASGLGGPASPFSPYTPFSPDQALQASLASSMNSNRTVYLGNIHPETNIEDLCNSIRGGVLQSIRYMTDKHIAFVTFIDAGSAFTFFQVASFQGLTLNNRRLKIGWGKNPGPLSPQLALAVHSGATRNVYIGNIEDFESFNEQKLRTDFAEYGDIELVNFLREKNCAFVNFTHIQHALRAIEGIKTKPGYENLRIAHGKDRCANAPRNGPQGGAARRGRHGIGAGGASGQLEGSTTDEPVSITDDVPSLPPSSVDERDESADADMQSPPLAPI